jgi:hypothetical protein
MITTFFLNVSQCDGQGGLIQDWRARYEVARVLKLADTSACDKPADCAYDYYAMLGVKRHASPTDLKKARKTLLLKLHPGM